MTAVMAINAAKAATFIAIRTDKIHLGGFQCAGSRSDFMSSSSALSKFVMLYLLSILSMIKERMEPIYRLFGERLVSYMTTLSLAGGSAELNQLRLFVSKLEKILSSVTHPPNNTVIMMSAIEKATPRDFGISSREEMGLGFISTLLKLICEPFCNAPSLNRLM